jgi:oligosaccharide repeat unit polymerase
MNNYEFYEVALNNITLFFGILMFSIFLHYFIFRSQIKSLLDPYFLAIVSSVFCLTDVFLLYFTDSISFYLFLSYLLTQFGFFLGLYFFKVKKKVYISDKINVEKNKRNSLIAFYFFSFVYLISQCIIYKLKGIPLFMESRLETFASGGGTGVLGRISDVCSIFSLYAFFLVIKIDKFRISEVPKYIILLMIFTTFFLSGSKSSFLIVFSVFWCFIIFAQIKGGNYLVYFRLLKNNLKLILIISFIVVFFIIYVQSLNPTITSDNSLNPVLALCLRFVHSGDIYWYAYPNNVYLKIKSDQWFAALFNDTLGLLRVRDWSTLPEAIGITFKNIHHPSDVPQGPNARHNVFGLIYYGFFGSVVFSFGIGVVLSFIRNKLPYILRADIFGGATFTYLMCRGASIDSDPMLTVTYFNNIIFILPVFYILYLMLIEFLRTNPNKNE